MYRLLCVGMYTAAKLACFNIFPQGVSGNARITRSSQCGLFGNCYLPEVFWCCFSDLNCGSSDYKSKYRLSILDGARSAI